MKATLHFNLPEEESDFKVAQEGGLYKVEAYSFECFLRGISKYGIGDGLEGEYLAYNESLPPMTDAGKEDFQKITQFLRHKFHKMCPKALSDE